MRRATATSGDKRKQSHREPDDPAFINTDTAGAMLNESGRTFRDRWDPTAGANGGWIFHYGDVRYVIPNCPKGKHRRVPVNHILAIRNGQVGQTAS